MEFFETTLPGLYRIKPFFHEDARGTFVKTFRADLFAERGLQTDFEESFYSESLKGVIRGMHFQTPPYDHAKLVFAMSGEVLDVIVDLRTSSPTFGQYQAIHLSAENREMLYLPKGVAHGFCSLTDRATLFYFTTKMHHAANDTGIRYDSFGFAWPVTDPVLSPRDLSFSALGDFDSPF